MSQSGLIPKGLLDEEGRQHRKNVVSFSSGAGRYPVRNLVVVEMFVDDVGESAPTLNDFELFNDSQLEPRVI
ncbi:hypothetical protein EV182_001882, partial [Spiromyces aspiralis]